MVLSKSSSTPTIEEVDASFNLEDYSSLTPDPSTFDSKTSGDRMSYFDGYDKTLTTTGINLTLTSTSTSHVQFINSSSKRLRLYSPGQLKFQTVAGYTIKSITLTAPSGFSLGTLSVATGNGSYSNGVYTAADDETAVTLQVASGYAQIGKINIVLLKSGGGSEEPETHTPTAISYVLAGAEAVAMDNFVAKNVEIKAGATLSFIDPDGYAYGAAEADATLANNTATELTEYAPATAADVKAFKLSLIHI